MLIELVNTQLPQPGKLKVMEILYSPAKLELLKCDSQVIFVAPPAIGRAGGFEPVVLGEYVYELAGL